MHIVYFDLLIESLVQQTISILNYKYNSAHMALNILSIWFYCVIPT
jgi:hypothetical protein